MDAYPLNASFYDDEIDAEEIRLLYRNMPTSLLANLVTSALVAIVLWGQIEHTYLLAWFVALLATLGVRYVFLTKYRNDESAQSLPSWRSRFILGAMLTGIAWGMTILFLLTIDSNIYDMFIVIVLAGLAGGSAASFFYVPRSYYAFATPTLLPLSIVFMFSGQLPYIVTGILLIVFYLFLIVNVKRSQRAFHSILKLQYQNTHLIDNLTLAKDDAEQASEAKSEFLSSMSHEFRTPLSVMLGHAQLLDQDSSSLLSEQQKSSVARIIDNGWRLLKIVNKTLDLTEINNGKLDLNIEPVDMHDVVDECLQQIKAQVDKRNIRISLENAGKNLPLVSADRHQLKRVLDALLENAIQYNVDGGSINFSCQQNDEHRLCIHITNSGECIAAEDQEKLFQPFERLGATKSNISGAGIGLVICKRLLDIMDGNIAFEKSSPDEGTTFRIELTIWETARK